MAHRTTGPRVLRPVEESHEADDRNAEPGRERHMALEARATLPKRFQTKGEDMFQTHGLIMSNEHWLGE